MLVKSSRLLPLLPAIPDSAAAKAVRVSEVLSALSYALDLTEGRPMGHSARSCLIGLRLGREIGLSDAQLGELFYALILKDAGCSSNASRMFHIISADEIKAKRDVKLTDWTRIGWDSLQYALSHVATGAAFLERVRTLLRVAASHQADSCELIKIRCERGASIARRIGFPEAVAQGIHSLDEHWNGGGYPDGLRGEEIPMFARIMNLAQTLEVFLVNHGAEAALDAADRRSRRWFDPALVRAAQSLASTGELWEALDRKEAIQAVLRFEPAQTPLPATEETLENICQAFAEIIDAKSPFTYRHSNGVCDAAVGIAEQLDLGAETTAFMRRAALLHDVGKLGVPNSILEKPAGLDPAEWESIKKHPYYSYEVLRRIPGFAALSQVAGAHHEKLDGSGYFRGWDARRLSIEMRILTVADIFDALNARRPYRDALPMERVFEIMRKEAGKTIDAECLEALVAHHAGGPPMSRDLAALSGGVGQAVSPELDTQRPDRSASLP